ncbi:MAG: triphosphoribosyl-dephospho-CoA synthase CitG [Oscillospiraceae bacterium]|nr:triphosphoribosyl-dephospho-CoA synthase CitG [Oscillospiraceae bacterium]
MEATLQEILDSREKRAKTQKELLEKYQKPLVCFTMNIPGPVKMDRDIAIGFAMGERLLKNAVQQQLVFSAAQTPNTGAEGFYVVDMDAKQLKKLVLEIEEIDPIGRLFDMDVIDITGKKVSREDVGYPRRKCLLCDEDAVVCASRRTHSLEKLRHTTGFLLYLTARKWMCEYIGTWAYYALTQELSTTPKPGLVDRNNAGAHKDMTPRHFFASADALRPFFNRFAEQGFLTRDSAATETFSAIRSLGKEAEQAMLQATGGVNTHKGAIFSLGILCAAAGRLGPEGWNMEALLTEAAAMTHGLVEKDFAGVTEETAKTAGERLFAKYGVTGVRGQAEAGFPEVRNIGMPMFQKALQDGQSLNNAGCIALLHMLATVEDTNLIHRGGMETAQTMQQKVAAILEAEPYPARETLLELDKAFIEKNLSPGGTADLLAIIYFLYFLK